MKIANLLLKVAQKVATLKTGLKLKSHQSKDWSPNGSKSSPNGDKSPNLAALLISGSSANQRHGFEPTLKQPKSRRILYAQSTKETGKITKFVTV